MADLLFVKVTEAELKHNFYRFRIHTIYGTYKTVGQIERCCFCAMFIPQPLRLWGLVITRGGRAVRNSAVTKKLTDEFC